MSYRLNQDFATPALQSKLPTVDKSIFTVMSELARSRQAVNLSQGFPDFPCDPVLIDLVQSSMREGYNQYAPAHGLQDLREVIAAYTEQQYGCRYDPNDEITITSGATEGIYAAISAIVQPEDEVIVFEPCYDSYVPAIVLNGGIPVYVPLKFPDYSIDWEAVKKYITRKTRCIIINTPHNPSGKAITEEELHTLTEITRGKNIVLISDEVYEYMTYDGFTHTSVCSIPELAAKTIKIGSFGKTLHATGWKVGYCLAPAAISKELRKVHQFITFSTSTPFQKAIANYIIQKPTLFDDLRAFYQTKKDFFAKLMEETRFRPLDTVGSYFQLYSYKGISDEDDVAFVKRLVEEYGVAAIPISVFYRNKINNHVIRFCFAKEDQTLIEAVNRLKKV